MLTSVTTFCSTWKVAFTSSQFLNPAVTLCFFSFLFAFLPSFQLPSTFIGYSEPTFLTTSSDTHLFNYNESTDDLRRHWLPWWRYVESVAGNDKRNGRSKFRRCIYQQFSYINRASMRATFRISSTASWFSNWTCCTGFYVAHFPGTSIIFEA
jgi:hypothetical protein